MTLFACSMVMMLLGISSTKTAPHRPVIKPIAENHQLADAIFHQVASKEIDFDLHEEKRKGKGNVDTDLKKVHCSKPVSKVGFMKTHKTASSTVQNILMRYAMNSDWNVAMYSHGSHLGPPSNQYLLNQPFSSRWLNKVPWLEMVEEKGYNIFAFHTKWNQREVEKVLGKGAKYVTILRDPVNQFESLYNYVHFEKDFNMGLEQFVINYIDSRRPVQRVHGYLGRNQQLWDLGMEEKDITNPDAVNKKIKEMDKEFDLVMISEDFDSSLVLLSDVLCWPLKNMTSLKLNARKKSAIEKLSDKARETLKDWLWADYKVYNYFKKELELKKQDYGIKRLNEEISYLHDVNAKVKSQCVLEVVKNTTKLSGDFVPWSKDVLGFKIDESKEHCKFFGISENHFIDYLRKMQMTRLRSWRKNRS